LLGIEILVRNSVRRSKLQSFADPFYVALCNVLTVRRDGVRMNSLATLPEKSRVRPFAHRLIFDDVITLKNLAKSFERKALIGHATDPSLGTN
jgi:hypothetical protein